MEYELSTAKQILARTPATLEALLLGLSDEWLDATEGGDSWSPRQVVAHMLGAERSAWIPRLQLILDANEPQPFQPFDRTAEIHASRGRPFGQLIAEFGKCRRESLHMLSALPIDEAALSKTGIHPEFGLVELRQLLATWTVHDLAHLVQIERTMAKQYSAAVGPWIANFRVIR